MNNVQQCFESTLIYYGLSFGPDILIRQRSEIELVKKSPSNQTAILHTLQSKLEQLSQDANVERK